MASLLPAVSRAIKARRLLTRNQPVLVAVSGGLDSVVLLHLLQALSEQQGWRLVVAHFNHRLRGRASDGDERFVKKLAAQLGLRCLTAAGDVRQRARQEKVSLEMAARDARHEFLARTARRLGISQIALGHHADDQVELFFLRLFRGSSGAGVAAMKWIVPSPKDPRLQLVRPLLGITRAALKGYAAENQVEFREDATNQQTDHLRNRIRHELLPLLQRNYQPAVSRVVARSIELLEAEAEFVAHAAAAWAKKRRPAFAQLHPALQRKVVELGLLEKQVAPRFELIEQLRLFPGQSVTLDPQQVVELSPDGVLSLRRAPAIPAFLSDQQELVLGQRGTAAFGLVRLRWQVISGKNARLGLLRPRANCEYFDAEKIGGTVRLRHWKKGDRFQPIGRRSAVKLQDWLTNQKVGAARKRQLMVAEAASGLLFWVQGCRIAEGFKLDSHSKLGLKWQWWPMPEEPLPGFQMFDCQARRW